MDLNIKEHRGKRVKLATFTLTLLIFGSLAFLMPHSISQSSSASVPYIDFQGTIWARDGSGPPLTSPYDTYYRFLHMYDGQANPTRRNVLIPYDANAVIEGLELSCTESACDNFYVDGRPFCTSKYIGGSFTIYIDDSVIITIEDVTIVLTSDLDAQEINGYGWGTMTGVPMSEGGYGLYEAFTQFSESVLITDIHSRYPAAWSDPFQYDITFRLTVARACEISLFEGWNLIGLPCIPEDPSIEVVLSEIIDYVECVWAFDGETKTWSCYSPGVPSFLTEMVEGRGYWIKVNMNAILTIHGICDGDSSESGIVLVMIGSGLENIANQISIEKDWIYLDVNSSDPRIIHDEIVQITQENQVEYLLILGDDDQIPIVDHFGLIPNDIHNMIQNILNETLDTLYYGNIDNDEFIELSVGRLPLHSEEEIVRYYEDLNPNGDINLVFEPGIGPLSIEQAKDYLWRYENINYYEPSSIEDAEYLLQNSKIFGVYSHGWSGGFNWFSMNRGVPSMWNNRPIVVVEACETASLIGKEFIRQGASAYVGYYFIASPTKNPMPIWEESTIGKSLKLYMNRLIAAKKIFNAFCVDSLFILYGDPSIEVDSPNNVKDLTEIVIGNENITIVEPHLNSRLETAEYEFFEEKDPPIYKIRLRGLYPPGSEIYSRSFFFSQLESYKEGNYVLWYHFLNQWFSPDEALKNDDVPHNLIVEISEEDAILYSENWHVDMEILNVSERSPFQFGITYDGWFISYYYVFQVSEAPNITSVTMKIGDEIISTRPFGMYAGWGDLGTFAPDRFGIARGNDEVYVVISLSSEDIANLIRLGACEESFEIIIKLDV